MKFHLIWAACILIGLPSVFTGSRLALAWFCFNVGFFVCALIVDTQDNKLRRLR